MKSFSRIQFGLKTASLVVGGLLIMAFVTPEIDPFQWLEDLHSTNSMTWVEAHNKLTYSELTNQPFYSSTLQKIKSVLSLEGKLGSGLFLVEI